MLTHRSPTTIVKIVIFSLSVACLSPLFLSADQPPTPALAAPTELFFSEYVEGSSNNKALEIYNGTGADVTFNGEYAVEFYFNGNTSPTTVITLTGVISANDVFVIADNDATQEILDQADQLVTNQFFNGNDAIVLRKNGIVIDSIGQIGNKDDKWGENKTLRRNFTVEAGDTNGEDIFDPSIEWEEHNLDTFDGLGSHPSTISIPTATPTETAILTPTVTASITSTLTLTPTPTPVPSPTNTPSATTTPVPASPGAVVINEIVTDPQQDWSSNDFSGVAGDGSITNLDEFIELYIKKDGLDLTGWTIELTDSKKAVGDLASGGAFKVSNYISNNGGLFTFTAAGDFLVLGDVAQSGDAMNNDVFIVLKDNSGIVIDKVELGDDIEGDGDNDGAPDGTGRGGNAENKFDEAVIRYPNGQDTDNDVADFIAWSASIGQSNGLDITPTPTPTPTPPALPILISEFVYDGLTPSSEGDEFVELCNPNDTPADLTGYKVGDEEIAGGGESMYQLPDDTRLAAGACLVIAKNAVDFQNRFGFPPDFEAAQLDKYTAWGRGSWSLANDGDELVVVGPADQIFDSVAYRNGDYATLHLEAGATAPEPNSLQRVWPTDTDSMPHDFVRAEPNPGVLTAPPSPPDPPSPPAELADGLKAYWGHLHAHTTYSDGAGPPHYALAKARAAGLHFYAITDHAWWLDENEWLKTLPQVEAATVPGEFIALRGLEWTHSDVGHINLFNTDVLVSHENPLFSDLSGLYTWLAANPQIIAQFNHPDPSYGGTFADFAYHPAAAQVMFLQEIGNHAQTYTTYEPSFVQSNTVGWRVAPANNSDTHNAMWGSDTPGRTGIIAPELTTTALLEAMRQRRVFATEDSNLAVTFRVDNNWMGSVLNKVGDLSVTVDVIDLEAEAAKVYLYDRNLLVATAAVASNEPWQTQIDARPGHYFWVKVVQADGDRAYSAPVWIEGQAAAEMLYINEVLPAPGDIDWDGDDVADYRDEWVELYNPSDQPVGLGGWRLSDSSGATYYMPLELSIPAKGYLTLYSSQLGFALNNGEDSLTLRRPDNTIADTFSYANSPGYDESWCRVEDGGPEWSDDCIPSPNGQNWEREPAQPLEAKIYEAKRLTLDAWVRVSGHVTVPPGLLSQRAMYVQDETAGILVYLPKDHQLYFNLGDKVRVEGNLKQFRGEFEIVVSQRSKVKFIEPGSPPPPLPIETTMMLEPFEGRLVMLTGQAVRFKGRTLLWVDDGSDPAKVYIRSATGIKKPFIEPGTPITVTGVVSQYSDPENPTRYDYRLLPRYQTDLVVEAAPDVYEPSPPVILDDWPTLLPETGDK